ncbi:MAG: uroporphyrinogen-III synthase [Thermoflavifilum sp.]|nr:uroporphyrinogen-III synthase [Thermoflavifilum sp.]
MDKRIHLLFTRHIGPALLREAQQKGVDISCESFIEVRPLQPSPVANLLSDISTRPIRAIFTSAHAAEAVLAVVGPKKLPWIIFSLEGNTRSTVLRYQPQIQLFSAPDARQLAQLIIAASTQAAGKNDLPIECYFFSGNRRLDTLPRLLTQYGIPFREIVVYETHLTPKRMERLYDGYAFFSPSAVESFFSLNELPAGKPCFAMGETTAEALRKHTRQVIVSSQPQTADLLYTIYAYFGLETHQAADT